MEALTGGEHRTGSEVGGEEPVLDASLPDGRSPRVLAVYSFRYDAHLVPALQENIAPLVDGWISYDDRNATGEFSNESARRVALLTAARDAGAEWALAVDPDERFETRLRRVLPRLLDGDWSAYYFPFREMYTPTKYRVDGVWGAKKQTRLLKLTDGVTAPEGEGLHLPWHYCIRNASTADADVNIYHLKMISAHRRRARADLYERLDPDHQMQAIGYRYLDDEAGIKLRRIPVGRGYRPRHLDDDGLWMSDPENVA